MRVPDYVQGARSLGSCELGAVREQQSLHRLSQKRFEHDVVNISGLPDFDVSYVLTIAFKKASRVLQCRAVHKAKLDVVRR